MAGPAQSGSSTAPGDAFRNSRPLRGRLAADAIAVRRHSRSKSSSISVDSANANSSSTESNDRPAGGRVSASCPMISSSARRTTGWKTVRTPPSPISRESSSRRTASMPSRSTRLTSTASVTACWMARSGRPPRSPASRAWPAARRRVRSTLLSLRQLDAGAQRAHDPLAPGGGAAAEVHLLGLAHEDEEAVGAHRVQADDVARAQHARLRKRGDELRELAHRLVVRGPAQVHLVAARAAEIQVDDVHRARRGLQGGHVAHHRREGGQTGERVEELALVAQPFGAQTVVVALRGARRFSHVQRSSGF